MEETFSFDPGNDCTDGAACSDFYCFLTHPASRPAKCNTDCCSPSCKLLHPILQLADLHPALGCRSAPSNLFLPNDGKAAAINGSAIEVCNTHFLRNGVCFYSASCSKLHLVFAVVEIVSEENEEKEDKKEHHVVDQQVSKMNRHQQHQQPNSSPSPIPTCCICLDPAKPLIAAAPSADGGDDDDEYETQIRESMKFLGLSCNVSSEKEKHFTCTRCLSDYICKTWATLQHDPGTIPPLHCPGPNCAAEPFLDGQVAKFATPEALSAYLDLRQKARDVAAFAEAQKILAKKSDGSDEEKKKLEKKLLEAQLQRQFPQAKMCPMCSFGPITSVGCADLTYHQNEVSTRFDAAARPQPQPQLAGGVFSAFRPQQQMPRPSTGGAFAAPSSAAGGFSAPAAQRPQLGGGGFAPFGRSAVGATPEAPKPPRRETTISNRCAHCAYLPASTHEMLPWDGVLREPSELKAKEGQFEAVSAGSGSAVGSRPTMTSLMSSAGAQDPNRMRFSFGPSPATATITTAAMNSGGLSIGTPGWLAALESIQGITTLSPRAAETLLFRSGNDPNRAVNSWFGMSEREQAALRNGSPSLLSTSSFGNPAPSAARPSAPAPSTAGPFGGPNSNSNNIGAFQNISTSRAGTGWAASRQPQPDVESGSTPPTNSASGQFSPSGWGSRLQGGGASSNTNSTSASGFWGPRSVDHDSATNGQQQRQQQSSEHSGGGGWGGGWGRFPPNKGPRLEQTGSTTSMRIPFGGGGWGSQQPRANNSNNGSTLPPGMGGSRWGQQQQQQQQQSGWGGGMRSNDSSTNGAAAAQIQSGWGSGGGAWSSNGAAPAAASSAGWGSSNVSNSNGNKNSAQSVNFGQI